MEERKFKVGDKVKFTKYGEDYYGEVLKVRESGRLALGLKGFNGHNCEGDCDKKLNDLIKEKGYDGQCWNVSKDDVNVELVEKKEMDKKTTGNKVIDVLMEELGVKINEEFNIEGQLYNPYHFNEKGELRDRDDDDSHGELGRLVQKKLSIEKIPKHKKLFISQPMRGKTDEQILAEREKAIKFVKAVFEGEEIEVIDSFFKEAPHEANPLWYLAKSLELLSTADVAYFVKGWEDYRGCKIENQCAKEYGIATIEQVVYETM